MSSRVVSLPVILRRLIPSVIVREEVPKNLRIRLFIIGDPPSRALLRMTERFFAALRMTDPPLCHPEESRLFRDDEGSRRTLFEILPLRQAQGKAFAKDDSL